MEPARITWASGVAYILTSSAAGAFLCGMGWLGVIVMPEAIQFPLFPCLVVGALIGASAMTVRVVWRVARARWRGVPALWWVES